MAIDPYLSSYVYCLVSLSTWYFCESRRLTAISWLDKRLKWNEKWRNGPLLTWWELAFLFVIRCVHTSAFPGVHFLKGPLPFVSYHCLLSPFVIEFGSCYGHHRSSLSLSPRDFGQAREGRGAGRISADYGSPLKDKLIRRPSSDNVFYCSSSEMYHWEIYFCKVQVCQVGFRILTRASEQKQ